MSITVLIFWNLNTSHWRRQKFRSLGRLTVQSSFYKNQLYSFSMNKAYVLVNTPYFKFRSFSCTKSKLMISKPILMTPFWETLEEKLAKTWSVRVEVLVLGIGLVALSRALCKTNDTFWHQEMQILCKLCYFHSWILVFIHSYVKITQNVCFCRICINRKKVIV